MASVAGVSVGAGLLAAHVSFELSRTDEGATVTPYFLPAAAACSLVVYAACTWPWRWCTGYETLVIALPLAWWAGVVPTFAVAFMCTSLVLVWLSLVEPLVRYDLQSRGFYPTRATFYASMRAVSQACVERLDLPLRFARLLPLLVATLETLGMFAWDVKSYAFPTRSWTFAVYALHKSVVVTCVPLVEEALLTSPVF